MEKLSNLELNNVKGGSGTWLALGIGAIIVLLAGVIDGWTRPIKCND